MVYNKPPRETPITTLIKVVKPISFILNLPLMIVFFLFDAYGQDIVFYLDESALYFYFLFFLFICLVPDNAFFQGCDHRSVMGQEMCIRDRLRIRRLVSSVFAIVSIFHWLLLKMYPVFFRDVPRSTTVLSATVRRSSMLMRKRPCLKSR